jgi:hypothetical protein
MEQPADPSELTETFVPAARPEVVHVEVDGEIVLYDDRAKVMHRLSPTAGQVWRCFDGSGSLAEIAADLAEVYQADPDQVLTDVVATARQFGSAGLLVGVGDPPDGDGALDPADNVELEETDSPFVPEPGASCMDGSFPLGDAGSLTVKAGPYLLGVRFSTPELVDMARDVFASSLVEGVVAPPNVAVKVTEARAGQPLLYCYRSNLLVTRARSPRRAFEAASGLLSSYVRLGNGGLRLFALPAVRSGVIALFSPESWQAVARLVPRLRRAGWEVLDAPEVELDRAGGVVIAPPSVAPDATALAGLSAHRADGIRPAPGRYPVAAWVALAGTADPMPESMAGRVALVTANVLSLDAESAPLVVESTAAMLGGAAWAVSPSLDSNDLAATLADAVA